MIRAIARGRLSDASTAPAGSVDRSLLSGGGLRSIVFSLNVPVPGEARQLTSVLRPTLSAFETVRDRPTLVLKRFGEETIETRGRTTPEDQVAALRERLRPLLARTAPFEVRIDRIDFFERPTTGPGPVVYLAVESGRLEHLHRRLVDEFGAIEGLEGEAYVPHVTLARGGSVEDAERLADRSIEPIEWRVSELALWDARFREPVGRMRL